MRPKEVTANLVSKLADMSLESEDSDEDTDDELYIYRSYAITNNTGTISDPTKYSQVKHEADFKENKNHPHIPEKVFAISDGGADKCIVGLNA